MKKLEIILENGKTITIEGIKSYREVVTVSQKREVYDVGQTPTEGMLYEVNWQKVYVNRFEKPRPDKDQEWVRQAIQKAFNKLENNPEKYGAFYTLIPKKKANIKTVSDFENLAQNLGGERADWVHQALEWAQRICNNESWETVCNKADTANFFRLVKAEAGLEWLVGGSRHDGIICPASNVTFVDPKLSNDFSDAVPLVVFKKATICVDH